uniref:Uncharacterized protein n=1 Tax=Anguilla anguilla TaxID=7936 RepID=A0A0E9TMY9_ANGAN
MYVIYVLLWLALFIMRSLLLIRIEHYLYTCITCIFLICIFLI